MLSHISVINFRNYAQCRVAFQPGINVLHGPNGAGKTNLLEALSLLTPGRGLRHAPITDLIPFDYTPDGGMNGWGVTARLEENDTSHTISTGMTGETLHRFLNGETAKRHIRIDSHDKKSQDSLTEYLSVLWLTPSMDGILAAAPSEKRRFFDRIVFSFDPAHAGRLSRYEKALRSRNQLLKDEKPNLSWIKSYHETLAKTGIAIAESRLHTIGLLNATAQKMATPFPKAIIEPIGQIECLLSEKSALEAENHVLSLLDHTLSSDIQKQATEIGVHKSDFTVSHCSKNTEARFCSTGEQKAMLISIILAYANTLQTARRSDTSLLLLDEMVAHLDEDKRASLFDYLLHSGLQVFATGTDINLFRAIENKAFFYHTQNGTISC